MLTSIVSAALLGAVAVSAVPAAYGPLDHPGSYPTSSGSSGWHGSSTVSSSSAGQTPFKFPLSNGFPNVDASTLHDIEEAAHGTLPNGALPTSLNQTSVVTLELIAFNEIFEVAFFTDLIYNITNNVRGYEIPSPVLRSYVLRTLTAVQAQEELHFLGANGILKSAGQLQIQPCEYVFPVDNFDDAIRLASTFTDVVLGTLQDAQNNFATDGDAELVPLIGSVIGQEGEQDGYYRSLLDLIPSQAPFLTRSAGQFAFSVLNQDFVVPGSCPTGSDAANPLLFKALPIFGALNVVKQPTELVNQNIEFSVAKANVTGSIADEYSVTFINQQNVPVTSKITNVQTSGDYVTFQAYFAFADLIADGLTIAAVTKGSSSFASVPDVAAATVFGPGLIEIN